MPVYVKPQVIPFKVRPLRDRTADDPPQPLLFVPVRTESFPVRMSCTVRREFIASLFSTETFRTGTASIVAKYTRCARYAPQVCRNKRCS